MAVPVGMFALWGLSSPALACGGLFCSNVAQPVDQTGERIVFALDEDAGKVEVHVQVAYEGPAEQFAWIVPMPEPPEISLSTDRFFAALDQAFGPRFQLTFQTCVVAESDDTDAVEADSGLFPGGANGGGGGAGGSGGVEVLSQAEVGPYATAVLRADDQELLLGWLDEHDYYVPPDVGDALAPYVADGSWFVALRLQKDRDVGELSPVAFTYAGTEAVIPITLTKVAATPDMGIVVHVLGSGRAVPDNYLHVVPNLFLVDWWNGGANYQEIVARAADEAGGQAFATDFAGPGGQASGAVFQPWMFDEPLLRATTTREALWVRARGAGWWMDDRLAGILQRCLGEDFEPPLSFGDTGGWSLDSGLLLPDTDADTDLDTDTGLPPFEPPFDPDPCVDEIVATFVTPARHAEALLAAQPWLTRLSSAMSPAEMTQDPLFVLNPTMGEVPALRQAVQEDACDTDDMVSWLEIDGRRIQLPNGASGPSGGDVARNWLAETLPFFALRIEDTSADGPPVVLVDHAGDPGWLPDLGSPRPGDDPDGNGADGGVDGDCGCASSTGSTPALAGLLLLGVTLRRRGRSSR